VTLKPCKSTITMLATAFLLLGAALNGVTAHYTFPRVQNGFDWQYVRRADNFQSNGFVADVNSQQIRCFQNIHSPAQATLNVTAGSTVTYYSNQAIFHPGPMSFYMARVPDGQDINSWKGEGAVWFKIYHEQPTFGSSLKWSSEGMNPEYQKVVQKDMF